MKKKVLITGITGQDGIFLSNELLKSNEYNIIGTSRSSSEEIFRKRLTDLGNKNNELDSLTIKKCNLLNNNEIDALVEDYKPDYVYNLIGPGSVSESVKNPFESSYSIIKSFNNLVNSFVKINYFPNFFQTSSSEMFEDVGLERLTEDSDFDPKTPYAISKVYCHNMANFYKDKLNWNISCGILFNHESEFRSDQYLTSKIISEAIKITKGEMNQITIGSLNLVRDWGFAGDVVKAMIKVNENPKANNYVVGTGKGHSIKEMVDIIFKYFELEFEEYLKIDSALLRKNEPQSIISNPNKISTELGWKSETSFEDTILRSIEYKLS